MTSRKFRWSTDGGASWTYEDRVLPYVLPGTADLPVTVEPIGPATLLPLPEVTPPPPATAPATLYGLWNFSGQADGPLTGLDGGSGIDLGPLTATTQISGGLAQFSANSLQLRDRGRAVTPVAQIALPAGLNGPASGGFTCTGLDRITSGTHAGAFVLANDGRKTEGSPGTQTPSLVLVSGSDPTVKIAEWPLTVPASVQGVAFDTSDGTIWYADQGGRYLRRVDQGGTQQQALSLGTVVPNGLAYVPALDQLIVAVENSVLRYVYRASDGALVGSFRGVSASVDQLHYDPVAARLYESWGVNGTDGWLSFVDMDLGSGRAQPAVGAGGGVIGPLTGAQAMEGAWIDRAGGSLWVASDGGYHAQASPARNLLHRFSMGAELDTKGRLARGRAFTLGWRAALGGAPAGSSERIFGEVPGRAQDISFGVYHAGGTGSIRLQSGTAPDGKAFQVDFPAAPTGMTSYLLEVDLDQGRVALSVDGVAQTGTVLTGASNVAPEAWAAQFDFSRLAMGQEQGGSTARYLTASVAALGFAAGTRAADRAAIAGLLG